MCVHDVPSERQRTLNVAVECFQMCTSAETSFGDRIVSAGLDADDMEFLVIVELVVENSHVLYIKPFHVVLCCHFLTGHLFCVQSEHRLPVIRVAEVGGGELRRLGCVKRFNSELELRTTVSPLIGVKRKAVVVRLIFAHKFYVRICDDGVLQRNLRRCVLYYRKEHSQKYNQFSFHFFEFYLSEVIKIINIRAAHPVLRFGLKRAV